MNGRRLLLMVLMAATILGCSLRAAADPTDWSESANCLSCHSDRDIKTASGVGVYVTDALKKSVHASLLCIDCHGKGDYDNAPHFKPYVSVRCATCHEGQDKLWKTSAHGRLAGTSNRRPAACVQCHSTGDDPHAIDPKKNMAPDKSCYKCHPETAKKFLAGKHAGVFGSAEKPMPCGYCHDAHREREMTPEDIFRACSACHKNSAEKLRNGPHGLDEAIPSRTREKPSSTVTCSSCHEPHGASDPARSQDAFRNCATCHQKSVRDFTGSVHQPLLAGGDMTCASCHSIHLEKGDAAFHCGDCHQKPSEEYGTSAHFKQNPSGLGVAANCGDCHDKGHGVRRVGDPSAMTHPSNQPQMCGRCHGVNLVVTDKFVRLPMTLSNYKKSIHYQRLQEWAYDNSRARGAVCTDCHESHMVRSGGDPTSMSNRLRLADTCGKCHPQESKDYKTSVHGAALQHGLQDTPDCHDCHESHMILAKSDPQSRTFPTNVSADCGRCHENSALTDRFGIWGGVVKSYRDSYHGWALGKSEVVANCQDCHTTHRIRSRLDPSSTTSPSHVAQTCGRCHSNANAEFARSYSHESFGKIWGVHDYVRVVWICMIVMTLGGMLLHNVIVFCHYLRLHKKAHLSEDYVLRMNRAEIWQHILLAVTFTGLAITGFALRFPNSWWAEGLRFLGMDEPVRSISHRLLAAFVIAGTVWHVAWVAATARGRRKLLNYLPRPSDASGAFRNILYHLGARKEKPGFGVYDYTQKAEYWALVWGTFVMALTGFILWFPSFVTSRMPGWVVRVAEVIHFYEAILAVSAILIWHFFFVFFHPKMYPMSLTFLTGRIPAHEWHEFHGLAEAEILRPERKGEEGGERQQHAPREE